MDDLHYIVCQSCNTLNRFPAARLGDKPKCGSCKQPIFTAHPIDLTDANFKAHVEGTTIPVVVDFWAPWCGPCKMMKPYYEQAAGTLEPYFRLAELNTETEQATAARYEIAAIPTLIIFKNGVEAARQSGAMDYPTLVQWIRSNR